MICSSENRFPFIELTFPKSGGSLLPVSVSFLQPDGNPQSRAVYVLLLGIMTALCRLEGPTRLTGGLS